MVFYYQLYCRFIITGYTEGILFKNIVITCYFTHDILLLIILIVYYY